MANRILVTGAAGRVGGIGRGVARLLLKEGHAVRAMVRNQDARAQALRDAGAEVVIGDLLDLDSMHRAIAGCEALYFGMPVSDTYLAATVNAAAVANGQRGAMGQRSLGLSPKHVVDPACARARVFGEPVKSVGGQGKRGMSLGALAAVRASNRKERVGPRLEHAAGLALEQVPLQGGRRV